MKNMKTKKILVYTLILLLSISFISGIFAPAKAETTFTPITLPCTITESGNYAISGSWTGSGVGLNISASNVIVDGQNYSIDLPTNSTGDYGVYMDSQSYVTLQNLNVISAKIGLQVNSSNTFTIVNCSITNGFDNGLSIVNCTDFNVGNCSIVKNYKNGINVNASNNFQIFDCNASANLWGGILASASSEFGVYSCNVSANTEDNGFYAENCDSFTLDSVDLSYNGWHGFSVYKSSNYALLSSNCCYNHMAGVYTGYGNNSYIQNCVIDGNGDLGIVVPYQIEGYFDYNEVANNPQAALVYLSDSISFNNNNIENNGLAVGAYYGGIQATDSNCTLYGNNFDSNYDALLWEVSDSTSNNTFNANDNIFQNNTYTMFLDYGIPSSNTNQKLYFFNNFINDSALIDPICLTASYSGNYLPINSNILNLNTTTNLGERIYSNGPVIGGNFWATPDSTGISQISTDADQDGFVDSAFNLFNNASIGLAYDYHPYSLNFNVNTWINITLPARITSPGNYRITAPYTGRGTALTIEASNVTVDGQNNLIQNLMLPLVESDIAPLTPSGTGVMLSYSENLTLMNFNIQGERTGIRARESSFTVTNSNFSDCTNYGILVQGCYNYNVQGCNFLGNSEGLGGSSCVNGTISGCYFNNNIEGIDMTDSSNCTYINSMFNNSSAFALWDIYSANETISGNCFDHTGTSDSNDWEGTALFLGDVDCKVSNNIFLNNYNGFFWGVGEPEFNYTQLIYNNKFIANNNTMLLCCFEPNNCTNEKLYFYNNFVNDTNYVNPYSFSEYNSGPNLPFNSSILIFKVPLQAGTRVYSNGGMIGGNYWAYPNGTGPSQTGTDANHDGFIDTKFDIFNNASIGAFYDYLPLSTGYISNLTFTVGTSQSIAPNQPSSVITVSQVDAFGPVTSGFTVNLISSSIAGIFSSDASGNTPITRVTIPANSSSASFYYRDAIAGTPTITVTAQNANPASTVFSITYGVSSTTPTPTVTPTPTPTATPTPTPTPIPTPNTIQANKDDNTKITIAINGNITTSQFTNATITTNQTAVTTTLSFTVTGETGTSGFCNMTISKAEIPYGTTLVVYIDGQPAVDQGYTQDSQNYYVWYTTHFSTHNVELRFTGQPTSDSESPMLMYAAIIAVIAVALAIAVIAVTKRKHKPAKTPQ